MRINGTLLVILSLLLALSAFSGCDTEPATTPTTPDDTNDPPIPPYLSYPEDSAEEVSITPSLYWGCSDPEDDDLTFTVRLTPTEPGSMTISDETTDYSMAWSLIELAPYTEYVWQVVADDGTNDPVESDTYTFTTSLGYNNPPARPDNPDPNHGADDVDPDALTLTWECFDPDGDPIVYDVYLDEPPYIILVSEGQTEKQYDPGILEYDTRYDWQIIAHDDRAGSATSLRFTFSTKEANHPPEVPSATYPVDDEPAASLETTLSWTCTDPNGDPLTYDVWFGPPLMELPVATGISETFVNLEGLRKNTEYSWSVTAYDDEGGETHGPFWKFTTANETYTELEVLRRITNYFGEVTRGDHMKARFDAAYAPGVAIEPLQPYAVKGGPHNLEWLGAIEPFYFYRDPQNDPFLTLGSTYTFIVSNDAEIAFLQTDLDMPACEHYFTSPDMNTGVSLSGFTVEWYSSCPGAGTVDLYVRDPMDDDATLHVETENDGSYTFSSGELSSLSGSFELFVDIIAEERNYIDETGYYEKSFWRGIVTCTLMLYVM